MLASGEKIRVPAETVAAFRVPYRSIGMLKAYSAKRGVPFGEMFALFCAENGFFPEKAVAYDLSVLDTQYVQDYKQIKRKYSAGSIAPYADMFTGLFDEIECFPIPTGFAGEDNPEESPAYIYGDSWGVTRNYEGEKHHMGTDILDRENIRGRLGVVSMTDGQVHDAGWREPLGYYVGVETTNGNYYLYAHLDTLAEDIAAGMPVSAGQALGRMGNTGDSRSSDGAFQVHLHVAISPQAGFTKNKFWINPYPLLRYIEDNSILA